MQAKNNRIKRSVDALNLSNSFYCFGCSKSDLVVSLNIICNIVSNNPKKLFSSVSDFVRVGKTDGLIEKIANVKGLFKNLSNDKEKE